jgi:hypothetical protein
MSRSRSRRWHSHVPSLFLALPPLLPPPPLVHDASLSFGVFIFRIAASAPPSDPASCWLRCRCADRLLMLLLQSLRGGDERRGRFGSQALHEIRIRQTLIIPNRSICKTRSRA